MPANVDGMVREGISAYRAGRKDEARALLLKAVELDERHEQAWLWLSAVVDSVDEQQICLENVLAINPGNDRARQGLQILAEKAQPPASPPAPAEDVVANAIFTPAPGVSPFSAEADDELPSAIPWNEPPTATSSASSVQKVNEPSPAEYDDWVNNLNLGGTPDSLETAQAAAPARTNLEEMQKFMSADDYDDTADTDLFGITIEPTAAEDVFGSGPFSAAETAIPPATTGRSQRQASPSAGRSQAAASSVKPDPLLDEVEAAEDDDEFISEFEDYDQITLDAPDPAEMFHHIPKEIKATRLPGTRERYPLLVLLGLPVAIAANVAAVAFLVYRLTGG